MNSKSGFQADGQLFHFFASTIACHLDQRFAVRVAIGFPFQRRIDFARPADQAIDKCFQRRVSKASSATTSAAGPNFR